MNEMKSRQGEGFDFYDYDVLGLPAAGAPFIEAVYVVGTNQNAAIQGAWPNEGGWTGSLLTANVAPGAVALPVTDIASFVVGQMVIIIDPVTNLSETAIIGAIIPTPLPPPLANAGILVMIANLVNPYLIVNAAVAHLYLPVDAQNTMFYASVPCLIRLTNRALVAQQVLGILPATVLDVPVQIEIPATIWITLPDKWFIISAIAVGPVAGTLIIKTSG